MLNLILVKTAVILHDWSVALQFLNYLTFDTEYFISCKEEILGIHKLSDFSGYTATLPSHYHLQHAAAHICKAYSIKIKTNQFQNGKG